jgi:hypothetical protein
MGLPALGLAPTALWPTSVLPPVAGPCWPPRAGAAAPVGALGAGLGACAKQACAVQALKTATAAKYPLAFTLLSSPSLARPL